MRGSRLPWILLVAISAFGYGSGPLFAKWIYPTGFDWLDLLAWRHLLAALILWGVVLLLPAGRAALRQITPRRGLTAFGLGVLFVANASTYFASLTWIDASLAGLMTYAYPAIVAVLSIFFAHAPSGVRPWIALFIATSGVVLGVGGISAGKEPALIGLVLGVASPIIYSCYIILAARLGGESKSGTGASRDGGNAEDGEEGVVWDREWKEVTPSEEPQCEDAERGAGETEWHRSEWRDATTAACTSAAL